MGNSPDSGISQHRISEAEEDTSQVITGNASRTGKVSQQYHYRQDPPPLEMSPMLNLSTYETSGPSAMKNLLWTHPFNNIKSEAVIDVHPALNYF